MFMGRCASERYIRSIPTRRSSDLASATGAVSAADNRTAEATSSDRRTVFSGAGTTGNVHAIPDEVPGRSPPRDRKSTRLNSSHGYISYAVFCLKKNIDCFFVLGEI